MMGSPERSSRDLLLTGHEAASTEALLAAEDRWHAGRLVRMSAAWYEQRGPAREVMQVGELPVPDAGLGEVRVRVAMSGVNPSDTKTRGAVGTEMPWPRVIPHQDGAGVIDAVGRGVDPARMGERVWLYEAQLGRPSGTAAQFTVVPEARAVRLPAKRSFSEGACLGVPALTAHACVFSDGPVEGKVVLVAGAVGGVGQYAVQLAKWGGATVIATVSSAEKVALALSAGADHVVDYTAGDVASQITSVAGTCGVHRVVEVAFGPNLELDVEVLSTHGVISTYASDGNRTPRIPFTRLKDKSITVRFVLVYQLEDEAKRAAIRDVTAALESDRLSPVMTRTFPLHDIVAAHEFMETGHTAGKVLVAVPAYT